MKSFMSVCLDKNSRIPIYRQLGDALLSLIDDGILKPDTKLPPIRKMAKCLKINSSTVVNAYKYLENKKAVYGAHGSGIYVTSVQFPEAVRKKTCSLAESDIKADFSYGDTGSFDISLLTNAVKSIFTKDNLIKENNRILVFSSEIIFDMLAKSISANNYAALETPVSFKRAAPYIEHGAKILTVPVTNCGIDISVLNSMLENYNTSVIHLSAYFQTPTNICYTYENKRKILELCAKYKTLVIEEDNFSDLIPGDKQLLKSLDESDNVVYVKNLTKLMMPSVCVFGCALPEKIAEKREFKRFLPVGKNDLYICGKLYELLCENDDNKIIGKIADTHNHQRKIVQQKICKHIGKFVQFNNADFGFGFWIKLKQGDSAILADYCAKRGVFIVPGCVYYGADDTACFWLGFNNLNFEYLDYGLSIIKDGIVNTCISNGGL